MLREVRDAVAVEVSAAMRLVEGGLKPMVEARLAAVVAAHV